MDTFVRRIDRDFIEYEVATGDNLNEFGRLIHANTDKELPTMFAKAE